MDNQSTCKESKTDLINYKCPTYVSEAKVHNLILDRINSIKG